MRSSNSARARDGGDGRRAKRAAERRPRSAARWALAALGGAAVGAGCASPEAPRGGEAPLARLVDGDVGAVLPVPCRDDECDVEPRPAYYRSCPTGTCFPGGVNGPGVYVDKGGEYCLRDGDGFAFCPEAFVAKGQSVRVLLRDYRDPAVVHEAPVAVRLADEKGDRPVDLLSLRAEGTALVATFSDGGGPAQSFGGGDLERLTFTFEATPAGGVTPIGFELRVEPDVKASTKIERYRLSYRMTGGAVPAWTDACGGGEPSSFFPGVRVDGMTAQVDPAPYDTVVSCRTGAVDACLEWGYHPWDAGPTGSLARSIYLFASCLQAKRAAYLAGYGDPTSYTVAGTPLYRRDHYGINGDPVTDDFEAIWSPAGALCLDRMRHEELRTEEIAKTLPRCSPIAWSPEGKFATGMPPAPKP